MRETWSKPPDAVLILAVKDAMADLDAIQNEQFGADRTYTTGDRAMHIDYWGTRGATHKRQAEVEFLTGTGDWKVTLRAAQADYEQGLQAGYSDHWILGQFVVLRSVLSSAANVRLDRPDRRWEETCRAVRLGLDSGNSHEQMWAWSSLADLRLVSMREGWPLESLPQQATGKDLERMIHVVGGPDHCPALWPTFRQFWRWRDWWKDDNWAAAAREGYDLLWTLVRPRLPVQLPTAPPPEEEPAARKSSDRRILLDESGDA